MANPTVKGLKAAVAEFLSLVEAVKRYGELEAQIKADMTALKFKEMEAGGPAAGRVFISTSDRVSLTPEQAINELGEVLAERVIVTKRSVSNDLIGACVKAGVISEVQRDRLFAMANKTVVTRLHVRPLN